MTRILIADDEPLARERLKMLLVGQEGFEVVGECHDGPSTIDAIRRSKPDLVFLDVQMPGANGFEVVSALGEEELPLFVFVTAFDQYALKAFDFHALDYLLKPFDRDRFLQALARARQQLERPSNSDLRSRLLALVKDLEPCLRVPGAQVDHVDRPLEQPRVRAHLAPVTADHRARRCRAEGMTVEHPRRSTVDLLHVGHAVAQRSRRPAGEEIGCFAPVRIAVDHQRFVVEHQSVIVREVE